MPNLSLQSRMRLLTAVILLIYVIMLWKASVWFSESCNDLTSSSLPSWHSSAISSEAAKNARKRARQTSAIVPQGRTGSRNVITIIIQLGDEGMANQLCRIAFGYAVKWQLETEYNTTSKIMLRHHERGKVTAWNSIRTCFPKMRIVDFFKGNTQEFENRQKQQLMWVGGDGLELKSAATLSQTLKEAAHVVSNTSHPTPRLPVDANITLPFLYANSFVRYDMVDRFYERFRELFEYDVNNRECCGTRALPFESIFHARGFEVEIPRIARKRGFGELSPEKTVKELLKNHLQGDKIAVLSRSASFGQLYVDQMLSGGLDARLVETSNGEQSFCFLMSGQTEIIGLSKSSFMRWAAYLGNASKTRFYSLKTPERTSISSFIEFMMYNHTNPKLRDKFSSELYNSEAQDQTH